MTRIRAHFPAFDHEAPRFFENAGGSFPCRQTVDALAGFYTTTKVQPYAPYGPSRAAGEAMDRSRERWAAALGVGADQLTFGPSTSANTYVLAAAFRESLRPDDTVIVTNQDHEANTGAIRRAASAAGASVREWQVDPHSGMLDLAGLENLLDSSVRLVTFPHCSNIVGVENDVRAICALARDAGAATIVDGVSLAPHGLPDVAALGATAYVFSLYKTYSVHQGLMVLDESFAESLPAQSHWFNADSPGKRMAPAGPDHAQVASAGAVLDYIEDTDPGSGGGLAASCRRVAGVWQELEDAAFRPLLDHLDARSDVRLIGPAHAPDGLHRAPTVAFVPTNVSSAACAAGLVERGIMTASGDFYAVRLLQALGIDPEDGVVRLSGVHYTSPEDVLSAIEAVDAVLDG